MCPNYTSDPCASVQAIHQVTVDTDGNESVLDLKVYNASFMRAICPIVHMARSPLNYAQQYVTNLDPELKNKLESKHTLHLRNINLSRRRQMDVLHETMEYALNEDKVLTSLRSMINHQRTETEMSGTARSGWIVPIIKRYPFIVKAVVDCKDGCHSPLVSAGDVGDHSILDKLCTKSQS